MGVRDKKKRVDTGSTSKDIMVVQLKLKIVISVYKVFNFRNTLFPNKVHFPILQNSVGKPICRIQNLYSILHYFVNFSAPLRQI